MYDICYILHAFILLLCYNGRCSLQHCYESFLLAFSLTQWVLRNSCNIIVKIVLTDEGFAQYIILYVIFFYIRYINRQISIKNVFCRLHIHYNVFMLIMIFSNSFPSSNNWNKNTKDIYADTQKLENFHRNS